MAGRKPLPSNLKLLKGTAQPCRMNKNEPKPKSDSVKMPTGLNAEAKKCWKAVSEQLKEVGILTNLDAHALSMYCITYARWLDANDKIEKMGAIIKAPSGYPIQNPYLSISNKALDQMRAIMTEFGMTPSSRSKITTTPVEETDELQSYLKRRK